MNDTILLATINARYIHSAFGLRYLKANLAELESETTICEFNLHERPLDIAEKLLARNPKIIGLGVYVWNAEQSYQLASLLQQLAPEITLILGGPEVSYEQASQPICQLADYVINGPGEAQFYALCHALLNAKSVEGFREARMKLEEIRMPYYLYTDEDIRNRVIYVEASRGCPFRCEFCLSALDKTAWAFPLNAFLQAMKQLYQRGARHFKFVDRTFNLNIRVSLAILQFFLDRVQEAEAGESLLLHFEVIPDRLPAELKEMIQRFPPGSLQFEVGVQTLNPEVQAIIQRKQDADRTEANLSWLSHQGSAHVHCDLIFGLPGETLQSMATSFDRLVDLGPHEIQLGILKRLRGMPMLEQADTYELVFSSHPPYEILSTRDVDFPTMQRLRRMARYWDMVGNSGRFKNSLPLLLNQAPFERFMQFSDWLYKTTGQTHKISLRRLFDLLYRALNDLFECDNVLVMRCLGADFARSGEKGVPGYAREGQTVERNRKGQGNQRQQLHLAE